MRIALVGGPVRWGSLTTQKEGAEKSWAAGLGRMATKLQPNFSASASSPPRKGFWHSDTPQSAT